MPVSTVPQSRPEDAIKATGRPFNGAEYLESLRDGREVYLGGERVRDVTAHTGLRNCARSVARLYDALHDPRYHDILTTPNDAGTGYTHRYFRVQRTREDLLASQQAIATWSRLGYGWMGRAPDYKAALTNTFGADPDWYGPYAANARRWYLNAQQNVPFLNHALVNPPIDRHKTGGAGDDVCVHVVKETDSGIIVSGAKVVATSAALTHYNFIGQTGKGSADQPDQALAFFAPISAPGLKLILRTSYEQAATLGGSPFDRPLSSRFDENDAILVLDRVFIPWEDVLIYRDPERARAFFLGTGFLNGFLFHGCTRFAVKLDFLVGLLAQALRCTGGDELRGQQVLLGEAVSLRNMFWSFSNAMAANPDPWKNHTVMPERKAALAYAVAAPDCYARIRDIIQKTVSSGLIYLPSSVRDLSDPTLEPYLRQYVRGSHDIGHVQRIKTLKLLWDATGSEFAGRHELYERSYAGGWEDLRLLALGEAERGGSMRAMKDLADQCMADYDESGWTDDNWLNP